MRRLESLLFVPYFLDGAGQNGDPFVTFDLQFSQTTPRKDFGGCQKAEPVMRFAGFLASDAVLADEVGFPLPLSPFLLQTSNFPREA